MKVRGAQDRARGRRFPQQQLIEPVHDRRETLPEPNEDALSGGVFYVVVEILVVEKVDRRDEYDAFEFVEVDDHAASRTVAPNRSSDGTFQPVRMTVRTRALPGVKRQRVGRFKRKMLANLQ